MVKSAADRKRDQVDWTLKILWHLGVIGSVAAQSLMGSRAMIVFLNIFTEQTVQVSFTEHDDVIEKLSA